MEFEWHCKSGLKRNIQEVKKEFQKERELKPIKILITGAPASGKSFFGKQLADHYNVTHIHAKKLLEEIENWNKEKEEEWNRKMERKRKQEELERLRQLEMQEFQEEEMVYEQVEKSQRQEDQEEGDKEDSKVKNEEKEAAEEKEEAE